MKQIDLERQRHTTLIEVVKAPKWLFFLALGIALALTAGFAFYFGYGWPAFAIAIMGGAVGALWVGAYPEYHMRRIKD